MDLKLNEEQRQMRDSARKFMEEHCTGAFVREIERSELGYSPRMWRRMAEMGWLGISLPEDCGGLGLGTVDLVVLAKELGRNLCPSPFLATVVIGGEAIARAGSEAQRRDTLPKIVAGEQIVAFAYQEFTRRFDPGALELRAREDGGGYVLDGTKMLLVVARTSGEAPSERGLTMFLVDARAAGIECKHTPTVARDHHYEVTFSGVRVAQDRVLGRVGDAWSVLEGVIAKAAVVFSGFTGGVSEKMHENATQYAKDRVQFGRPIGQMQLIQSYLATLIIEIWGSDTLTLFTAFNMDRGRDVRVYVAKTKAFAADTVNRTTNIGAQIFGGLGYMEEQDTTLYLRRGKQYQHMLGGLDYWEEIIAAELLDEGGAVSSR
jgi:alkylation response protein AidB-like acyl-CoA dehydrogenase